MIQSKQDIIAALTKPVPAPGTPEFMKLRDAIAQYAHAQWSGQNWSDEPMTEDERMSGWAAVATTLSLFWETREQAPKTPDIKKGDWCVYDLDIIQITETEPHVVYSTGTIRGGNASRQRIRPLTLQSKVAVESMDYYYHTLRDMDGSAGFNYPYISAYFADLALDVIDGDEAARKRAYDRAQTFVRDAHDYKPVIDGVRLFRPK